MKSNKIIYIKLSVNGREFLKCTSTNRMHADIEKIIKENFKKETKIIKSYEILREGGEAFNE